MDELELLIQSILSLKDVTKSKKQIVSELPKLERELQSDENARVKIIAGLDVDKSKLFIESQLNTLSSKIKVPAIKVGIDVRKGINNGGQINQATQSVKEYNQELNKTATIQSKLSNRNYASDNSVFIKQIKTLENEKTAVDNLVTAFNNYGIAVKSATSTKTLDGNGNLNNLTVSITSKTGEIESFKYAAQKANGQTVLMLQNITATDNAVQRLIQSQAQYNDQLNASAIKLQSQLDKIKSSTYTGSKPIDFSGNEKLIQQWNTAQEAIERMKSADKSAMASMKANAEAEISKLKLMVTEIKNAEYAATELRAKDIGNIKDVQTGNLDKFINQINNSKVPIQMLEQDIDNLRVALSNISKENPQSLTEFLNQFDVAKSKFSSFKEFFKSIGEYNNKLDKMAASWKKQGVYTDELKSKIATLKTELSQVAVSGNTIKLTKWIENFDQMSIQMGVNSEKQAQLNSYLDEQVRLTKEILAKRIEIVKIQNDSNKSSELNELNSILAKRGEELIQLRQEHSEMSEIMSIDKQREYIFKNTSQAREQLRVAEAKAADSITKSEQQLVQQSEKSLATEIKRSAQLERQVDTLKAQIETYKTTNPRAVKYYGKQFDSLSVDLDSVETKEDISKVRTEFTTLKAEIKAAGKEGKTFWQTIKDGAEKFSSWMTLTSIISAAARDIKKMVANVIELDSAMTNLKKVTDETDSTYERFLKNTSKQAKELHSTITDLIEQTSTWAKLGFNLSESNILAKASMIYSNVGEVDNEQAVTNIVSALKAFDIAAEDVMKIPDVYNKLGNEFAVSSKNLGSGMAQAATTMAMAGNDFNQVAAILTGAGEVLGDNKMDEIGNGMKTVTLRIQNQAGALKELGEEYEDLISVSKTQQQIFELTRGTVNIMQESDPNSFRSTYDILADVAKIIEELNDTEASELIQLLFGKNRANVGTAVLKAFQSGQIQKAYEAAQNSAGSAQAEFDKWSESIEAHLNTLSSSFESLSNTVVNSDFIKGGIDFLTGGLNLLDNIIDKFGIIQTLISAITLGTSLKNVGELYNTPAYALSLT